MPIKPTNASVNQPKTSAGDATSNTGSYAHRSTQQADAQKHLPGQSAESSSTPEKSRKLSSRLTGRMGRLHIKDNDPLKQLEALFNEKGTAAFLEKQNGEYPLLKAVKNDDLASVKFITEHLDQDALLTLTDDDKNNALHIAVAEGKSHCVGQIIQQLAGKLVSTLATQKNKWYASPVLMAARQGDLTTLKQLVEASDTSILLDSDADESTPLHLATAAGHEECVSYILNQLGRDQAQALATQEADNFDPMPVILAALNGHLPILKAMVKTCGTDILLSKDKGKDTPLLKAAQKDKTECVDYILQQVGKDQAKALISYRDYDSDTLSAIAARKGNLAILKRCFEIDGPDTFLYRNKRKLTALHKAIIGRHNHCIDYMLSQLSKAQIQNLCEQSNESIVQYAIENADLKTLKQLVNICSKSILLEDGKIRESLVVKAINNEKKEILAYLLTFNELQKQLSDINFFDLLIRMGVIHSSDSLYLLEKAQKQQPVEKTPWHHFNAQKAKESSAGSSEWPMMPSKPAEQSQNEHQAEKVLNGLDSMGIYLNNIVYMGETKEHFWSMGDLVAGVKIINALTALGAKSLDVVLSPPDDTSVQQRRDRSKNDLRVKWYRDDSSVAQYKLANLLPEFKPDKPLPQTINLKGCEITVRGCDDQTENLPTVMFSFITAAQQYRQTGRLPDSVINIMPYRFHNQIQTITTDIKGARGNTFFLNLPPNSVIKENNTDEQTEDIALNTANMSNRPDKKGAALASAVDYLAKQSQSGQLDISIVYGLHHNNLKESRYNILEDWSDTLEHYRSPSATDKKPTLLAVASNTELRAELKALTKRKHLKLIDLSDITEVNNIQRRIQALKPDEQAVCILPSLPKAQFDKLVLSSRLPTLTEGANLTSFLLENGHPHLSVLPSGNTPVAQDMGDPFEAIKAKAFSYKLGMNESGRNRLSNLTALVRENTREGYQKALEGISYLPKNEKSPLAFLQNTAEEDNFLHVKQLTIKQLLEKGATSGLGETGRKALLSALDPSPEAFQQYIRDAVDEDSATAHHFKLQQRHVNQPSQNAIVSALVKLGKYKGVI